ncbi:MAG: L-histidine N(alpha)-methyltransferase [Planctomycetes bacterium]|nr:L-histidine N(alpha)-methyltransferase [Planctomycetota bacterium]
MNDPGYRVLDPAELAAAGALRQFSLDVLHGLSEKPKRLPSRWIYDGVGSELFSAICELDEYYPTRCEAEILTRHAPEILGHTGTGPIDIVDLGAGDGRKTSIVLTATLKQKRDVRYVPIDISQSAMQGLVKDMRTRHAGLAVGGLVGEYFDALTWLSQDTTRRNLVMFLGSNIGNFSKVQTRVFLRQLWEALNPGDLVLIGWDLKKDIDLLLDAYNDAKGVTAQFNLNLLARINRDLGGEFDLKNFRHYATYDVYSGAVESYIVSMVRQSVAVRGLRISFDFDEWEPIHTEYSYKYLQSDIRTMAADTGFEIVSEYEDSRRWFTDTLWRVTKEKPRA